MSHYSTVALEIKDVECLVKALMEVGGWTKDQIEVHQTPKNLYGYQGDARAQLANVIIRRQYVGSASNDLGFVKNGNRYDAIISDYDSRRYNSAWVKKLLQMYGVHTATKMMQKKGLKVTGQKVVNGKVVLTFKG